MEKAIPLSHKTNRPCLPLEGNHNILHHWGHYWKENKQTKQIGRVLFSLVIKQIILHCKNSANHNEKKG